VQQARLGVEFAAGEEVGVADGGRGQRNARGVRVLKRIIATS
jgi:hypothetical protein